MLVIASAVAALGVVSAGAGRRSLRAAAGSAHAAGAVTKLTVKQTGSMAGSISYELTCGPAGGTLPQPARACRALGSHPILLTPVAAGSAHSCPFGQSSFLITGTYAGRAVDVGLAACTYGQGPVASRWYALVPSDVARLTVAPGRGIGVWRLGERESRIRAALGAGHPAGPPCADCQRRYTTGTGEVAEVGNHFFKVAIAMSYRAGRVSRIDMNDPGTFIDGMRLTAGASALRHHLRSWRRVACPGGETRLEHGAGPATIIVFAPFVTRLIVQRQPPSCG
jgi:hypothetical protein